VVADRMMRFATLIEPMEDGLKRGVTGT